MSPLLILSTIAISAALVFYTWEFLESVAAARSHGNT